MKKIKIICKSKWIKDLSEEDAVETIQIKEQVDFF